MLNSSFLKMSVNLVQYRGTAVVFNNHKFVNKMQHKETAKLMLIPQLRFTYSKSVIGTLEKGVKYVQS